MAQKAAKTLASRNTTILNRTHIISLFIHGFFILLRLLLLRSSVTRRTYVLYSLLSTPALIVEIWLEKVGRPTYGAPRVGGSSKELRKSGEDLEAKGLTEYLWDVLYWTFGCIIMSAIFGDRAWWLWTRNRHKTAIPGYSAYLAYTTFGGMRKGMAGLSGAGSDGAAMSMGAGSQSSNRQKMEKRGGQGQKVQYR
ncbi:MAG: hypothetical protein M1819_006763 [Sarea resinae]|nr:MAG: hypothetical protein M1819_006763 [Sarea resinae]